MLKTALKNWVAKMAATLLNFGTVILLSRNLGAENRGVCAFYTVVIAFCLVFNELAAGSTIVYLQQTVHWKQIRRVAAVWSIAASGIVCFVFWWMARFDYKVMLLLWAAGAANGVVTIQYNVLLGHRKYLTYNILSVLTPFLILAGLLVLVLLKMSSPFHYLATIAVAVLVAMVSGYWALRKLPQVQQVMSLPWLEVAKKSFSSGFLNQAGHVVGIINSRYIYYLLPAASLGVFTNALSLSEAMLLVPGSLGQIYYSQAAAGKAGKEQDAAYQSIFKRFLIICLGIMVLGIAAIWAVPDGFYTWLFGPQFSGVKQFLTILAMGMLVFSTYLLVSYFQSSAGRFERNMYAGLAGLCINIIGVIFLKISHNFSLINLAWLMVAAHGATAIAALYLYRHTARHG